MPYLRYPAIRGDRLAFVADDDVWVGSVERGEAWRLGAERAVVRTPRFSPDGSHLAWTSNAAGPPEVWVADLGGGPPRRLSWWADESVRVLDWTADGRVVAATAADAAHRGDTFGWVLPLDGAPEPLPYGPISGWSRAGDRLVLGVDQAEHRGAAWKRYRGGRAGKAWVDLDGSGRFHRLLPDLAGQIEDPQWWGERIVFVSDHEGWGNVYSCAPDGGDLRRHTDHGDAYARSARGDGERLVYSCRGGLYLLEDLAADSSPRPLDVRLTSGPVGRVPHPLDAAGAVSRVAPDATGRASALVVRGAAVWLTHRDGPARVLAPGGRVRARLAAPLGDDRAVWVTDAEGADALEVAPVAGGEESRRLAAGELSRVDDLAASPDGAWVATAGADGAVRLTSVASGETREVDRSPHDSASGLAWSPDSRWLAWSHPAVNDTDSVGAARQIRLAEIGTGRVIEATPVRFNDFSPVFTPDGRYLAFLSRRTFDPVYDEVRFDLGFPAATRPYLLRLAASTPAPLGPDPAGRPVRIVPPALEAERPEADAAPPAVSIDAGGLADRLVDLPVAAGRADRLVATGRGLVWLALPLAYNLGEGWADPEEPPKGRVELLDLSTGRLTTLADAAEEVAVTAGGRALVVRDGKSLKVVPADRRPADDGSDTTDVDLGRVLLTVDPPGEWVQMFEESARLMGLLYWTEDMGGLDWDATVARYRPLAEQVSTRDDLTDLLWELFGETGTSHAYAMEPPAPVPPGRRLGWLGADLAAGGDGRWSIAGFPPAEPSVREARSPLQAAGAAPGDEIVSIDGRPVDPATGPGPLLVGAANRVVEVALRSPSGAARSVALRPLASQRPLRYHAWVAAKRAAVRERSGGRLGYVHLPDMMSGGWAQMHRDLRLEAGHDGLVVDLRHNGGGHTSELVLERLSARVAAWNNPRGFEAVTYPLDAPRGPMAALIDQASGSDGDIGAFGFRQRGLGPLVGTRTWGGVVGIDGRYGLADGGMVTQPRYAFWFEGGAGWSVENHGVDPDVEVAYAPHDWAAGRDPQLEAAVDLVLAALDEHPPARAPGRDDRPSLVPPALPPRP